jgi:diguanylate cyclase (GGDEF)-like protein
MNEAHEDSAFSALEALATGREVGRLSALPIASTVAGAVAVVAGLGATLSVEALGVWLAIALAVALAQQQARQALARRSGPAVADERAWWRWLSANALGAGVFWGLSAYVLAPVESALPLPALAPIVTVVGVLWLPLLAFSPSGLWLLAVPALLPMAPALLSPPDTAHATMGSLFLVVWLALFVVTRATHEILRSAAIARRVLHHQATHDSLVGLVNRAEFHRRLAEVEARSPGPHAVLFIDLDHFKQVNDTVGHATGDALLCEIGRLLRGIVRRRDTAARLGGDEFAILMPECNLEDAARVAHAVIEAVAECKVAGMSDVAGITASLGIACTGASAGEPRALAAADRACYLAKRAGRNRFCVAAEDGGALRAAVRQGAALVPTEASI